MDHGAGLICLYIFTKKILAGEPIDVFGFGKMRRDFTYIDDIVDGIFKLLAKNHLVFRLTGKKPNPSFSSAPWKFLILEIINQQNLNTYFTY